MIIQCPACRVPNTPALDRLDAPSTRQQADTFLAVRGPFPRLCEVIHSFSGVGMVSPRTDQDIIQDYRVLRKYLNPNNRFSLRFGRFSSEIYDCTAKTT